MARACLMLLLLICCSVAFAFDAFDEDSLIPSDGFHDLLGLTPFWFHESHEDLRRTLGTKRDNLPSTYNDLTSQTSGSKTYDIAGSCSIDAKFASDKATLTAKDAGGCTKPSVKMIFDALFPSVDVLASTDNFINPESFEFESLEIVSATKEVTIEAKAKDTWAFVERKILLGDAALTLGFTAGQPLTSIKNWKIKAVGSVGVSTHTLEMTIDKPKDEESIPFTWKIASVLMGDLMGLFGITMSQMNFNDIGFDSTPLEGVTFNGATINGEMSTSNTFQIVAKAGVAFSQAVKSGDVYLILTRVAGKVTRPAIIIDMKDIFNIGEALEVFIRQYDFISDFGMIGRIERDCIIMLAKEDVVMVKNAALEELVSAFITEFDTKQIPKGVNVRVKVPMKENMKKNCDAAANIAEEVPEILPITIKISAGGLGFNYPEKFKSDLPSMLKCLDPQIAAELPSQIFPKPDGPINIKEMTIAASRFVKITVVVNGPFEFLGGQISIADLEVTVEWNKGDPLKFSAVTTITVGKLAVGLTLEKQNDSYMFAAYVESFKLNELEEMIGSTNFLDSLKLLGSLEGFGIKDFKLVKTFGSGSDSSLRVSGVPILWGWDKLSIEGLIWKPKDTKNGQQPEKAVAVGIVIEEIRLDKIMEKILGSNLFSVAWFSEMTAIVIISNAHGKVESEEGEGKPNEIGNKDKEFKPEANTEPDERSFDTNKLSRKIRSVRPLRPLRNRAARKRVHLPQYAAAQPGKSAPNKVSKTQQYLKGQRKNARAMATVGQRRDGDDDDDDDDDEGIKFKIPYLSTQDIKPGLQFIGIFNIPQDDGCKGDALCLWLAETVGRDATIEIGGYIGKGEFEFSAKFAGSIPIVPGKLNMQSIEMKVTLSGKKSSVRLECTLYWRDPDILGTSQLQLMGAVEVSLTGKLSLEFNMIDIWRKPFGFQYLAFGNLHLAIGIAVGAPLPSFEFGAEVWIGKIKDGTNDHAIKVAGYFGIDPNRPRDNYVYASLSSFTLEAIFKAFELGSPNMPDFVAQSGFPEGIVIAYSVAGKTIDALDIVIDPGLYLKGTINFLGFKVSAEIIANPPTKFLVDVKMSPIDWAGGLIQLRKSATDKKNGPSAFIYLKSDSITVQIYGYISLLGISREVYIDVSDTAFKFEMKSNLWGMIQADLKVEAAYGSLAALGFSFEASVSVNLYLKEITDAATEYLNAAADAAKAAIDNADSKLKEAQAALTNANTKLQGWEDSISAYQDKLRKRAEEIEKAKAAFAQDCDRECGKVCIPFLDWNPKCFKLWWWWIGCPSWNSCRWKVKNVICIAACEIKKLAKKFVAWAEQIGIKNIAVLWRLGRLVGLIFYEGCEETNIMAKKKDELEYNEILIGLSEIGKGLIKVGQGFVALADKLVDFGRDILAFAKKVVEVGQRIGNDILAWVGENLFKIDLLKLSGSLDSDFNACVGLEVECVIFGIEIDYKGEICVNINFWKNLAAESAEKKYPGTKKMNNELPEIDGKIEEFNKDKQDLDEEEKQIEKDVKKETTDRRKRDYVPTKEEAYYRNLAEEKFPPIVTRSAATINAFKNDAPWVLIQDFDARNFDHRPTMDENIPAEKRTLDEDWEKHAHTPCVQIHKVINKYSMIADGLSTLSNSMRNVRENYQATKRTMQQGVDNLANDVRYTEMQHNMTHEEREDLYHWYNEAKEGLSRYEKKAEKVLDDQHKMSLPAFRSQINHILMTEKKTDFVGYMNELHKVGEAAYKRSSIPNENMIEAAQELKGIKRDLIDVLHTEEQNPLKFMKKVRSIRSNIQGLRRSMERCN